MAYIDLVRSCLRPEARRILVLGTVNPELASALKGQGKAREIWGVQPRPFACEPSLFSRELCGRLLSLSVGTLPLHRFDAIIVSGDLPFGSELLEFLRRTRKLLAPGGRLCLRVPNSLGPERFQNQLSGGFGLDDEGSFTPMQARCALADAGFRVDAEEVLRVYAGSGAGLAELLQISEVAILATPTVPVTCGPLGLTEERDGVRASIVVLTYNSAAAVEVCLNSVLGSLGKHDEVIVVDNASQDATVWLVREISENSSQMRLIENERNLGFSAGCNVGIRASRGSFVSLLNPDTIVWPSWIESLMAPLSDPSVGLVGPLSDRIAGLQFVGHSLLPESACLPLEELSGFCRSHFSGQLLETRLLIGMCLMMRRSDLGALGLLDEDLYLGSDDLELSWRYRTHGLKLVIAKDAFVQHLGGVSFSSLQSEDKKRLLYESTEALLAKVRAYYGWNPPDELLWGIRITHQ